ncbi:DUF4265 domain-containing protein [Singulisphaera sp. Ch08]|uniref:DUF4265 domain-containing protein n=1 Tax=Singulisphaera sp. Ch08 TaxID=3120278 RepID=A0AAU7CQL1_9BACT
MNLIRVVMELVRDDEGYPPFDSERVWAKEARDGGYLIDNIPFFASQATYGDVIDVEYRDGEAYFLRTREWSKNSLLRVIFFDNQDPSPLRSELSRLGCETELSEINTTLLAINVPPNIDMGSVRGLLEDGSRKGLWDYEEAIIWE